MIIFQIALLKIIKTCTIVIFSGSWSKIDCTKLNFFARYLKILGRIIWLERGSELDKAPPKRRFESLGNTVPVLLRFI